MIVQWALMVNIAIGTLCDTSGQHYSNVFAQDRCWRFVAEFDSGSACDEVAERLNRKSETPFRCVNRWSR